MVPVNDDRGRVLDRCAEMALAGVQREFPCLLPLMLDGPTSFQRPRDWTPAFYGCFDWHSAVHSHWLLVRWLSVTDAGHALVPDVRRLLSENLTGENLAAESRFLDHPLRRTFERPYGLAWLLQLGAEVRGWDDPLAASIRSGLEPLERLAVARFHEWLPTLPFPVRTGEHNQTAFALGLVADWADEANDAATATLVRETALRFHGEDRDLPLRFEPSGHDFLSPALATADLMRRVLNRPSFGDWLTAALPGFPSESSLRPVTAPAEFRDGKQAHFAGLNFSRAWMLEGMAAGLPPDDWRREGLGELAIEHFVAGVPMLETDDYAVTHWAGTFAVYAVTRRGVREHR